MGHEETINRPPSVAGAIDSITMSAPTPEWTLAVQTNHNPPLCSVPSYSGSGAARTSTSLAIGFGLWETGFMPNRNLRIVKRFANIPVQGVCEQCNAQFSVDPEDQMMEVQAAIENQFNTHVAADIALHPAE